MFILVRRETPVAQERAPTGCIRGPRGCTGLPGGWLLEGYARAGPTFLPYARSAPH